MFTIENQGANSYLVYKLSAEDQLDTLSFGMLSNNKIIGFAPVIRTQLNEETFLKYTITSRVSMKQVLSSVISRDRLITIFVGIIDAIIVSDDYMLVPGSIVLDINNIYIDVSTYGVALICLPIMDKSISDNDAKKFFKKILFNIQVDQNENTEYFTRIINYLNMGNELSLSDFRLFLLSFKSDAPIAMGMSGMLNASQLQAATDDVGTQSEFKPNNVLQPQIQFNKQENDMHTGYTAQTVDSVKTVNTQKTSVSQQLKNVQIPVESMRNSNETGFEIPGMPNVPGDTTSNKTEKKSLFSFFTHKDKKIENKPEKKDKEKKVKEKKVKEKKKGNGSDISIPGMDIPDVAVKPVVPPTVIQMANVNGNTGAFRTMPLQSMGGAAANFGETTVLNSGSAGETTVLSDLSFDNSMPFLVRMRNNERIYIDKPVFRIGKERNYVDYFISDNTAVSRSHADIICKNGSYYVEDMNSTNHTYINGAIIHSGVQVPINNGDKVMFANEEYEFRTN